MGPAAAAGLADADVLQFGGSSAALSPRPGGPAVVQPLSPDRYRYQLTIGATTVGKLRLAKDMLRRALPSADDEAVLDRALSALLAELVRKQLGADRERKAPCDAPPRNGVHDPDSRHIRSAVKRAVWLRDLGRCAFVGSGGRRCADRAFLEFHHVRPWAAGGGATVENIELRCRRHNAYEARRFFEREPGELAGGAAGVRAPAAGPNEGSVAALKTKAREREVVLERVAARSKPIGLEPDRGGVPATAARA